MGLFDKFNPSVCKAHLKMSISRAKLSQNRCQNTARNLQREIAVLLKDGKEEKARIKAEQLLMEHNRDSALDILETFCELLITRMSYMASEKDCPSDLVSTVHSVIYCQPRIGLDELATVRKQLEFKYGKEWVANALDNKRQEVHFKLVHLLSVSPPVERDIVKVLTNVANEFGVKTWIPPIDPLKCVADNFIPKPSTDSFNYGPEPEGPYQPAGGGDVPPGIHSNEELLVPRRVVSHNVSEDEEDDESTGSGGFGGVGDVLLQGDWKAEVEPPVGSVKISQNLAETKRAAQRPSLRPSRRPSNPGAAASPQDTAAGCYNRKKKAGPDPNVLVHRSGRSRLGTFPSMPKPPPDPHTPVRRGTVGDQTRVVTKGRRQGGVASTYKTESKQKANEHGLSWGARQDPTRRPVSKSVLSSREKARTAKTAAEKNPATAAQALPTDGPKDDVELDLTERLERLMKS